jgi:hypothetical protein
MNDLAFDSDTAQETIAEIDHAQCLTVHCPETILGVPNEEDKRERRRKRETRRTGTRERERGTRRNEEYSVLVERGGTRTRTRRTGTNFTAC